MPDYGKVAICNDLVTGSMGEKVLWNYLLESIPCSVGVDIRVVGETGNYAANTREYLHVYHPDTRMIIQNATFIDYVDETRFTIIFLQDNLRAMGCPSLQQEYNLRHAGIRVANSLSTAQSYLEYEFEIIPIGVDADLFRPMPRKLLRDELGFGSEPIGIFVGNFSEVKGWSKIVTCINQYPAVTWILVSKYSESYHAPNVRVYNRIPQQFLAKLLNCANFFILGSPVETQCLAAIEACLCNIPILMPKVGIFREFSAAEQNEVGIFTEDLIPAVTAVKDRGFNPRKIILSRKLTVTDAMEKWRRLLNRVQTNYLSV
jgi:glycosyltransferase involved in cell wall biosynthesis